MSEKSGITERGTEWSLWCPNNTNIELILIRARQWITIILVIIAKSIYSYLLIKIRFFGNVLFEFLRLHWSFFFLSNFHCKPKRGPDYSKGGSYFVASRKRFDKIPLPQRTLIVVATVRTFKTIWIASRTMTVVVVTSEIDTLIILVCKGHKEKKNKQNCFRFAPHHFVQTGRGPPVLVRPSFEPVWQWASKQKSSHWPFSLFLVQFAFWRVENIRQGLKFLFHPAKRKFDLKQRISKAGYYFDSITPFQRPNRTERPDFGSLLSIEARRALYSGVRFP